MAGHAAGAARAARSRGEVWLSPKDRAAPQQQQRAQVQDARREILFEVAAARFLDTCGESYPRPNDVRQISDNRLARWRRLPVFRKRRDGWPMSEDSYKKVWNVTIETAVKHHPQLDPDPSKPR